MGANILAGVLFVFGAFLLFGDIPIFGAITLICSALVWDKKPQTYVLYSWIFAIAVAGLILSLLFGSGAGPEIGLGITR